MKLLNSRQASEHLLAEHNMKQSPETLANLRHLGTGPVFLKRGKWVFYTPGDLDTWAESLLGATQRSTREAAEPARPPMSESEVEALIRSIEDRLAALNEWLAAVRARRLAAAGEQAVTA